MKIKRLSKNSFVGPKICLGLLGVCALAMLFPISSSPEAALANTRSVDPNDEGHIALNLKGQADQVTTATADEVSYRTNEFDVIYSQTSKYLIQVNSMNGYGSSLFGQANPTAEIKGVGENKTPSQFGNNTWGYAVGNKGATDYQNFSYNTVPEYNTQTVATKTVDIPEDQISDTEQTDTYTLAFAAKIGSDSPADHYVSKVYLSVVRTPGRTYTVTYNGNKPAGATGDITGLTVTSQKFVDTGKPGATYSLSDEQLKLRKYKFLGWTTNQAKSIFAKGQQVAANEAVQYPAGSNIDIANMGADQTDIQLYAVWLEGGSLLDIDTMQEMTAEVCNSEDTTVGQTKRLRDTRDGNYYWVAKLKDGNCWMTQNLDYNVPQTLLAADTNVASDVTLPNITAINNSTSNGVAAWPMTTTSGQQNTGYNILAYYDPGKMLKKDPATTNYCDNPSSNKLTDSACTSKGWLDVSGSNYTPKTEAPQSDSASNTSATNNVLNGTTYDAHYLSGNYYSWALATANSNWNASAQGQQASGSICPKGWKLPTAGEKLSQYPTLSAGSLNSYNDDVSGSFANLFKKYGLATAFNSGNVSAGSYNVYDAPLYYLRSGMINRASSSNQYGYINNAGSNGYYWSSVVNDANNAYNFRFNTDTTFNPSNTNNRYNGMPIRCVPFQS